ESRKSVGTRLHVELPPAVGLLNKYLPVTQSRLRGGITWDVVPLPHAKATENAVRSDIAQDRSGLENDWRECLQRTNYDRSRKCCWGWFGRRCRVRFRSRKSLLFRRLRSRRVLCVANQWDQQ